MEVSGQLHGPAALPFGQVAGWATGPVWTFKNTENRLTLTEIQSRFPGCPANKVADCAHNETLAQLDR
jgi:hypothetical protein